MRRGLYLLLGSRAQPSSADRRGAVYRTRPRFSSRGGPTVAFTLRHGAPGPVAGTRLSTNGPMMMPKKEESLLTFGELGLSDAVLKAVNEIGYETPSPIQARTIPALLEGRDLVGQAQTGTGKTGAFALPLLSKITFGKQSMPQVLVLVPTRELAIQVSEAFQRYAAHMPGFHVLPIYGGQGYEPQLRQLRRETHVVVGTPGRLVDHLKRGTLKLDTLKCLVIDEADEMLRMGFIDEVEWILTQAPAKRQIALFSATMPTAIRRIATGHLKNPVEVTITEKTATAATIHQRFWMVSGLHKLDALTRILEGETFDAVLIFVRTRIAAEELAKKLDARGFACAPLSGDVAQKDREITVGKLRDGELDIIVATDVAARGLDVSRITHVINYDIPHDTESYIHRIGRTGRAGRAGHAILFVAPRERRLLNAIETATRQKIDQMNLPTVSDINDIRVARFKQRIKDSLATEELGIYYQIVEECRQESNVSALEIAAALAHMAQGEMPLLMTPPPKDAPPPFEPFAERPNRKDKEPFPKPRREAPSGAPRAKYRIEVGSVHGVKPGQIVGAIANEGGFGGQDIGSIDIREDHSIVELPDDLPREAMKVLKGTRVCGRPLKLTKVEGAVEPSTHPKPAPKKFFEGKKGKEWKK